KSSCTAEYRSEASVATCPKCDLWHSCRALSGLRQIYRDSARFFCIALRTSCRKASDRTVSTPFWNSDMPGHEFVDPRLRLASASRAAGQTEWLQWRLNRLRCMTPPEVSHRVLRAPSMQAERAE